MNADVLKGKWHQLKGDVKTKWGRLTDDDLGVVNGDVEKLVGRVPMMRVASRAARQCSSLIALEKGRPTDSGLLPRDTLRLSR
jgi:hypothetical protein